MRKSLDECAVEQRELLQFVIEVLERLKFPYAVVGSFASGVWGESRFTQDIDIVIHLDLNRVDEFIREFPVEDFYLSKIAIEEAVKLCRPFNIIHPDSGNKIDFMVVGDSSWQRALLTRRIKLELLPDVSGYVAAPEDVILGKLLYYREGGSDKHLRDIAGILKISSKLVDRSYLTEQASKQGVLDIWRSIEDSIN